METDITIEDFTVDEFTLEDLSIDELPPPAWHSMAQIEHGLRQLTLPPGLADSLGAVSSARRLQGFADAVAIQACRTLSHRAGREPLARQKVGDPAELSQYARDRWRAKPKSIVAHEVSTLFWQRCRSMGFRTPPRLRTLLSAHARISLSLTTIGADTSHGRSSIGV